MQILAGKYKGLRLQSSTSPRVRPTARRLRENLFEFLGLRITDARFLDLCSGSGAVGIEALSRGADHVTFVDHSANMCDFVRSNLALCNVSPEHFNIVEDEANHFLQEATSQDAPQWNIIFFDPPYAADYAPVIETLSTSGLLKKKRTVLVIEHSIDNELSDRFEPLHRWRIVRQGESCLSFYERKK